MFVRVLVSALILLTTGPAFAQQAAPSCQEQLLVKSTHDQLVVQKRSEVEDQLAQVAAHASVLQQKVHLLTKENADLKAKVKKLEAPADAEQSKD